MSEPDVDADLCRLCNLPLSDSEWLPCPQCGHGAHVGCWQRVGRCATQGCNGRPDLTHAMTAVQPEVGRDDSGRCRYCGYTFQPLETACPRCGPQDAHTLRQVAPEDARISRSRYPAAGSESQHMLKSVEAARRGPTADPFRRVTAGDQELPPVARGNLAEPAAAPSGGQPAAAAGPLRPPRLEAENTSGGMGKMPREAAGWSWGGLVLGPLWLLAHGQFGLLLLWAGLAGGWWYVEPVFKVFPAGALALLALYLGAAGNGLAWRARHYPSVAAFRGAERAWTLWGLAALVLGVIAAVLVTLGILPPHAAAPVPPPG